MNDRRAGGRWWLAAAAAGVLFWTTALHAQMPPLVAKVLANGVPDAASRCAYTRRSADEDGSKTERYDPAGPAGGWTLLTVDDRAPTEAELRRYAAKQEKREDRRHPLAFDLRTMVDPDGWRLRTETHAEAAFEFLLRPNDELDERVIDKVLGTLVVDRQRLQPVHVRIENVAPAYVAPLVRIARYSQDMRFRWHDELQVAVLAEVETHRRGRALGFRSLHQDRLVRYYDYACRS
jgi:hypothetical protein